MEGELYLCGTPIGNLEDMTFRAIRILKEADLIAAEDTRQTQKLLNHYEIQTSLTSYHEHNKKTKGEYLLGLLLEGKKIALVSDAGMPGISDPGSDLVQLAVAEGIKVIPVPGAVAAITGLVASGLPTQSFVFEGFLSRVPKKRRNRLRELLKETRTIIFYEAPHRLDKALTDILEIWGNRQVVVARELTKKHEEIWRGDLVQALEYFGEGKARGEITLIVQGISEVEKERREEERLPLEKQVEFLVGQGLDKKEAIKEVAKNNGISKREVYQIILQIEGKKEADT